MLLNFLGRKKNCFLDVSKGNLLYFLFDRSIERRGGGGGGVGGVQTLVPKHHKICLNPKISYIYDFWNIC